MGTGRNRASLPGAATSTLRSWTGANIAPLVLVPISAVFVWVAIWEVWLPRPAGGPAVDRTVTTVDADAGTRPAHKVTTIVKTTAQSSPSRRSETLVIVLLVLGVGAATIAVFDHRIGGFELDKDGIKITLNKPEKDGAAELVGLLARGGAGSRTLAGGLARYLSAVAAQRPAPALRAPSAAREAEPSGGLTADEAAALARSIAAELA